MTLLNQICVSSHSRSIEWWFVAAFLFSLAGLTVGRSSLFSLLDAQVGYNRDPTVRSISHGAGPPWLLRILLCSKLFTSSFLAVIAFVYILNLIVLYYSSVFNKKIEGLFLCWIKLKEAFCFVSSGWSAPLSIRKIVLQLNGTLIKLHLAQEVPNFSSFRFEVVSRRY